MFWSEYTDFNHKNGPLNGDKFIWKRKYTSDVNSHLWHQKYSLPCTKVLGFVACRFTEKVLDIGADERSWGDVKILNQVKYILSEVMYKRNRGLFIHIPVLNEIELNSIIPNKILMIMIPGISGMKSFLKGSFYEGS